jgi:FixJ family two-component response regulator
MNTPDVHVVIVDDDPPVRRALGRLLTAAGCRVSLCGSAEDFLVRSYDLAPTCLVLDVHLPRLSGLDLRALLGRLDTRIPIVFLTADQEVARSAEMRQTGHPCLIKPVDDEVLLRAISQASGQA